MHRKIRTTVRLGLGVVLGATAAPRTLHAQATSPAAASAAALTPPRLLTFVPAARPAEAADVTEEVSVELSLSIDRAGAVTDAAVVRGAGRGFDEAAVAAARGFVFAPARRGDAPIPARIGYRYVFEAAPPPPPTTGSLEGHVLLRDGDAGVVGAAVSLVGADGAVVRTTTTDPSGAFSFADLPQGRYRVRLASAALAPIDSDEEITAGDLTSVTYRMEARRARPAVPTLEFGATATIEAPPREVTKRSLAGGELLRMAGTRGDPLRAIEYMPGVGRSPQADFVIIRGASPADTEVQLEGAPVYRLYHFGGLTSFVQPRLLDRIDMYPGNFSARYGRKMGGIIDVGVRDPKRDRLHAMGDVNLVDSSLLLEGPISPRLSVAIAAKRSYMDVFIDQLLPKDEIDIVAAPVYWDYQAIVSYRPREGDRLRAMVYGSYDDFKMILAKSSDQDPTVRGKLNQHSGFHRAQLSWFHQYGKSVEHEISVSGGPYSFGQAVGPELQFDIPGYDAFARAEWRARVTERLRLVGGADVANVWTDAKYEGPKVTQLDGDPETFGPLTGRDSFVFDRSYNFFRPALYAEAIWQTTDRLTLVPGARVDYIGDIERFTFDPRLTARYQMTDTTIVKGGAGIFSQAPAFGETLPVIGNPNLKAPYAQHFSFGGEQLVGERLQLTVEGFYKRLYRLTVNSAVAGENLNNDGVGRIYGAEAAARLRPTERSSGFLSYTVSRSERNDHGTEWRLFNWDQTHILTVAAARRIGRGWDLSGTFRYVTGNPLTPVRASVYDVRTDTYKATYGAINSDRSLAFHRLDLRLEKSWQVQGGRLAAYVDVQNAYNRRSEEGRSYNYNFSRSKAVPGLPVIPSLGLRGEI